MADLAAALAQLVEAIDSFRDPPAGYEIRAGFALEVALARARKTLELANRGSTDTPTRPARGDLREPDGDGSARGALSPPARLKLLEDDA